MWARKAGCPSQYPSRVRVILQSVLSGAVGIAVYEYMSNLQINNLEVKEDNEEELAELNVTCVTSWPKRSSDEPFVERYFSLRQWQQWSIYQFNPTDYVRDHYCTAEKVGMRSDCSAINFPGINASYGNLTAAEACEDTQGCFWSHQLSCTDEAEFFQGGKCTLTRIPALTMNWGLGYPLGDPDWFGSVNDGLFVYANIFAMLCFLNVLGFIIHDLALLDDTHKNYVLDWPGLNQGFPMLARFPTITFVPQVIRLIIRNIARAKVKNSAYWIVVVIGVLLLPVLLVWAVVAFLIILVPTMILLFLFNPIRLSRIWVFIALVAMAVHGLILVILQLIYVTNERLRPRYALTWRIIDGSCECGCNFYMTSEVHERLLLIGLGTMLQSILTAVRCLKGLRRSQWANLLSVLFPVPVAVYSAKWHDPLSDQPPKGRDEFTGAQEEIAFDPFALMDEQPASKYYTLVLEPRLKYKIDDGGRWKPFGEEEKLYSAPGAIRDDDKDRWQVHPTEYIGCLGFPCLTGGYHAIMPSSDSEETEMDEYLQDARGEQEKDESNTEAAKLDREGSEGTLASAAKRTSQFRMLKGRANQFASHLVAKRDKDKLRKKHSGRQDFDLEFPMLDGESAIPEEESSDEDPRRMESALTDEAEEYEEERRKTLPQDGAPPVLLRASRRRGSAGEVAPKIPKGHSAYSGGSALTGDSDIYVGEKTVPARSATAASLSTARRRGSGGDPGDRLVPSMRAKDSRKGGPAADDTPSRRGNRRTSWDAYDVSPQWVRTISGRTTRREGSIRSMHTSKQLEKKKWLPALMVQGQQGFFDDLEANAIGKSAFARTNSIDLDGSSAAYTTTGGLVRNVSRPAGATSSSASSPASPAASPAAVPPRPWMGEGVLKASSTKETLGTSGSKKVNFFDDSLRKSDKKEEHRKKALEKFLES